MPDHGRSVRVDGRILYLTEDPRLLAAQLGGANLQHRSNPALLDDVSTDEVAPGWACYRHDRTALGRHCLVGLRGGVVAMDAVRNGGFSVVVSGSSKGCGSSRETAPLAELGAGIRIVIARSIERIYRQNAQNIGLLTSTDFSLLERIERGEPIPIEEFTRGLDPISAAIVERGGWFAYDRDRYGGRISPAPVRTAERPMTLAEKIIASHAVVRCRPEQLGVRAVRPGDALFVRADVRFSHEYVTAMARELFRDEFGDDARVSQPESVFAFRDHLTLLDDVIPEARVRLGLREQAASLATAQEDFARRHGIRLYGEVVRAGRTRGSEAICHHKVIEQIALPGQIVVGSDSHTCMAGALGCLAFGIGSSDLAGAWLTGDVRITVPQSIRLVLRGRLGEGVCAKDVMLHLLAEPSWRAGRSIGKILEFTGEGVQSMPLDERSTLTNMAVEAGAFTGIVEADDRVVEHLASQRGIDAHAARARIVRSDPDACHCETFEIDLGAVEPMVALPGDPRNAVPLRRLAELAGGEVRIDIAYGGSCTGGKKLDMDMYAAVLGDALARGRRVAPGVRLYVQFGSQEVRRYARRMGHIDVFERVGARLVEPSCGACIGAGPGVSERADEVTVSAVNRNFPGRSGPGQVYLASPLVVAASAVAGRIAHPSELGPER